MNLPANHKTDSTHLSAERVEHREWIGGRALTLLSHYWREDDPVQLTAAIGADWADVLEGIPADTIQKACIVYQREEPRRKPTPGAIYNIALRLMPKPKVVAKPEQQQAPKCTPEAAAEIMEKAGYKPRRFGGEE